MQKPNKVQIEAINHLDGPAIVVAGAGTGKTFIITQRIVNLIQNHNVKPDNILALTFTNKAANQMQERIDIALPIGTYTDWIMTFHSFCEKILKNESIYLNIDPDFKLISKVEAIHFFKKNIEKFSLANYRPLGKKDAYVSEILSFFSRLQDETVTEDSFLDWSVKNLLRELQSINFDILPFILLLKERHILLNKDNWVYKIRDIENIIDWEIDPIANIYHEETKNLDDNAKDRIQKAILNFELGRVFKEFSICKDLLNLLDFADLVNKTIQLFNQKPFILRKYQEKFKFILVDEFQDTNYNQYFLVKMLASPTNNIMVVGDDDQSIYRFRGASISNILKFKDDYPNAKVMVLTDNYRSSQIILDLAYKSIQNNNPDRLEEKLNIPKKLKSKSNNKSKISINCFENEDDEATYIVQKIAQYTNIKINPLIKNISVTPVDKIFIESKNHNIKNNQLKLIPEENKTLVNLSDIAILTRSLRHAQKLITTLNRAGIPYNLNQGKSLFSVKEIIFLQSFLKIIIDFEDDTSFRYITQSEFVNIDPRDSILIQSMSKRDHTAILLWLEKNLNLRIGNVDQKPIPSACLNASLISSETISKLSKVFQSITDAIQMIKNELPIEKILLQLLEDLEIIPRLLHTDTVENAMMIKNIERFLRLTQSFEEKFNTTEINEFLSYIESIKDSNDMADDESEYSNAEGINILTVHRAKGLEFKVVFTIGLTDRRFPSDNRSETIELPTELTHEIFPEGNFHLQEERRLFYVAITRAKEYLHLTFPIKYENNKQPKKPSIFLSELGFEFNNAIKESKQQTFENLILQIKSQEAGEKQLIQKTLWDIKNQKLSYTAIQTYLDCPYKFKLQYIFDMRPPVSSVLYFGQVIHETLRNMYKFAIERKEKMPIDKVLSVITENWNPQKFSSMKESDQYLKKGINTISNFYNKHYSSDNKTTMIEQDFKVLIDNVILHGKIDRVDIINDKYFKIIDYKTGKTRDLKEVKNDLQLKIYAYAFERKFKHIPVELSLFFIEHDKEIVVPVDIKNFSKIKDDISEVIRPVVDNINKEQFQATPGFICKYCQYSNICEFVS